MTPDSYAARVLAGIHKASTAATDAMRAAQERMKRQNDKTHRDLQFAIGGAVWLFTPRKPQGLSPKPVARGGDGA